MAEEIRKPISQLPEVYGWVVGDKLLLYHGGTAVIIDASLFKGDKGDTPDIQIGTVSTLDAGGSAGASITGTAAKPLLNLGIPKGADGVSPTVRTSKEGKTTTLTVTDATGEHTATVTDGADGVSPTVSVSKNGRTTTITITDADGTHTATIEDGADGAGGGSDLPAVTEADDGKLLGVVGGAWAAVTLPNLEEERF